MIAKTYFNDTFALYDYDNKKVKINDTGLAWYDDKNTRYKNWNKDKQWMNINERFMVWSKISPYNGFRKLWGVIKDDLKPGVYSIEITNNWHSEKFDGKKYFVLS